MQDQQTIDQYLSDQVSKTIRSLLCDHLAYFIDILKDDDNKILLSNGTDSKKIASALIRQYAPEFLTASTELITGPVVATTTTTAATTATKKITRTPKADDETKAADKIERTALMKACASQKYLEFATKKKAADYAKEQSLKIGLISYDEWYRLTYDGGKMICAHCAKVPSENALTTEPSICGMLVYDPQEKSLEYASYRRCPGCLDKIGKFDKIVEKISGSGTDIPAVSAGNNKAPVKRNGTANVQRQPVITQNKATPPVPEIVKGRKDKGCDKGYIFSAGRYPGLVYFEKGECEMYCIGKLVDQNGEPYIKNAVDNTPKDWLDIVEPLDDDDIIDEYLNYFKEMEIIYSYGERNE